MDQAKRKKLEKAGWRVGSATEFLELSDEESSFVEMKLALGRELRQLRAGRTLSQHELAGSIGSSQSRVAKMEAGDPSVSLDLLVRSLLALGATSREIAAAIAAGKPR